MLELIKRVAPAVCGNFSFEIISKTTEQDFYGYKAKDSKIHLFGTDKVCVAKAFGKYLENCLNIKFSPCDGDIPAITETPLPEKEFSAYILRCC